jgi:PAS domain S-box-containing protein
MAGTRLPKISQNDLEHQQLTTLVNSMVDGFIAVDEHIRVTMYNGAALNLLDLNGSISDKSLSKVLKPLDKNNQPLDILDLVRSTTIPTVNRDLKLTYTDGSLINLYLSIAPVHLGYGKKGDSGYVLMLRDITREKSLEEERDEFISVVSHELRTPIAIAEGNISNAQFIASKKNDVASVKDALAQAHNQVLFLADMINDLSTLSRAERGTLNVEVEPINVHDLVIELGANYSPQANLKGLKIMTEIDPKLELLKSGKLYVREVLQNFITNSIKYTQAGSVTIGAKPAPRGVEFSVIDTGIGISKPDQEKIFDKFFRSEDYRTRSNNGTGLGLYVTMKLARLLHAEISVHSQLNRGSTFTIFIPDMQ